MHFGSNVELQEVSPAKVKGRPFVKGQVANPKGRKPGYQNFVDRAAFLASRYSLEQTMAICKDPKALGKLSVFDAMIMQRFNEASQYGGCKSMDSILDRLLGKPDQFVRNETTSTVNVVLQNAMKELRESSHEDIMRIKQIIEGSAVDVTPKD